MSQEQVCTSNQSNVDALMGKGNLPDPSNWNISKMLQKYSYAFLVIYVLNKVGFQSMSGIIKAIAKVQQVLDSVIDDLNQLEQYLQNIQNLGWGTDPNTGDPWDPSQHTDAENQGQMQAVIENYLEQEVNDPIHPGQQCTNLHAMQYIWQDLFGKQGDEKNCLFSQLKDALSNPVFDQSGSSQSVLNALELLNDPNSFDGSTESDWTNATCPVIVPQLSFLQILQDDSSAGPMDPYDASWTMTAAFCHSYYNRTGINPSDSSSGETYNDSVGDVTNQFESSKTTLNGLNSTQSSDLSMYSQNLTSMIDEGQQIVQSYGEETKTYVGNFKSS
jgi:uncharacterized protein (DUF2164 family)